MRHCATCQCTAARVRYSRSSNGKTVHLGACRHGAEPWAYAERFVTHDEMIASLPPWLSLCKLCFGAKAYDRR